MASSFQASVCPTLRFRINTKFSTPFSITASSSNFMLKRLLSSSSASHFLFQNATYSTSIKTAKHFSHRYSWTTLNSKFSSPSRPLPITPHRRRIHSFRILAMAEQSSKTTTSLQQSHKHTNRLAAEHSPYLLQHAHNPVFLSNYMHMPFLMFFRLIFGTWLIFSFLTIMICLSNLLGIFLKSKGLIFVLFRTLNCIKRLIGTHGVKRHLLKLEVGTCPSSYPVSSISFFSSVPNY